MELHPSLRYAEARIQHVCPCAPPDEISVRVHLEQVRSLRGALRILVRHIRRLDVEAELRVEVDPGIQERVQNLTWPSRQRAHAHGRVGANRTCPATHLDTV